jgi:uncharacterized protein with von Willebrand factor type A (vWA) domain
MKYHEMRTYRATRTGLACMPSSPLLHNLVVFARVLRALGMRVTSGQVVELAASLEFVDIGQKEDFRHAARCLLVTRRDDIPLFDRAFEAFWRVWTAGDTGPVAELIRQIVREPQRRTDRQPPKTAAGEREGEKLLSLQPVGLAGEDDAEDDDTRPLLALYSAHELLRQKDFALFSDAEIADARRFLSELRWTLIRRRSRRVRPSPRGRRLDMRRSFRRSLGHGGEMLYLARRGPKLKRRNLVLLCDISGSMERYTRLFLHFLYAIEASVRYAEVFVFGTRLTRITRELRSRDPDAALAAVAARVHDWSGGTRIGETLRVFNREWARRVLGKGAIVMIISDGWDRGDPAILAAEMKRLQRASYRLIWLNPLLGSARYRPLTQGIQAALPYVDDFLPVHNLQSLEALAALLNEIQTGRPNRSQAVSGGPAA